jgi:hypothetical protein
MALAAVGREAGEVEFDQGAEGGCGFTTRGEVDFDKACCRLRCRRLTGSAPPLHERLIAKSALAAECGGSAASRCEFIEPAGLVLIGVTSSLSHPERMA